ncbi:hypothetical protein Dvina_18270 [Dactylosporangium vinaceum]|uniref:Uncharacterized protein n=1 Tax=Dactylosporangium vinaceum TaxID=53362 RepID=A0ABV5M3B1_9ACTN|nr:hypothetical protein [Dactylosporangium vinaceum]UAB99829.1 hypothetical protein Dvina_18270 [Dactylosporangium vinaceum]
MPSRFGNVVRVHRRYPGAACMGGLFGGAGIVLFVALPVAASPLGDSRWLPGILFAIGCVAGLVVARPWWRAATRLDRYLVAEQGVLVWSPQCDDVTDAIAWSAVKRVSARRVTWDDPDGRAHGHVIPPVMGRRDLLRSFERGVPIAASRRRRIVTAATAAAAILLFCGPPVWFGAVPTVVEIVRGEQPRSVFDLARLCTGGAPFRGAPAYHGAGPHPIAVVHSTFVAHVVGPGDAAQLVACGHVTGRLDPKPATYCNYYGGTVEYYTAHFEYDVREARTARHVATLRADSGPPPRECAERYVFTDPGSDIVEIDLPPEDDQLDSAFNAVLRNDAGG